MTRLNGYNELKLLIGGMLSAFADHRPQCSDVSDALKGPEILCDLAQVGADHQGLQCLKKKNNFFNLKRYFDDKFQSKFVSI